MRHHFRQVIVCALLAPAWAMAFTPVQLAPGWNLMGNSDPGTISAASTLGVSGVTTVWKWTPQGKWAFYTTQLNTTDLAAYAYSKGYDVLTSINPKEGYWVNASAATTISAGLLEAPPSVGGSPSLLVEADLRAGWNLLASADGKTPAQLNADLASTLSSANKSISTVWAWDIGTGKWRFYAPSLVGQGGTVLADYITSKQYLGFSSALGTTDGFWVNVAAAGTSTPPTAQEIVNNFLASYEATWVTSVPSTGAAVSAFLDACYLDGGNTKALNIAGFDNNLPNSIGWNRYRIGARRTQAQVLADRTSINPDGSTRRELDVQYRIDYADGTSDASDQETLISGSSAGSVMADGSVCSTPEVGSHWRFLGDRRKVFVALRPGNERAMHFRLDTGAPGVRLVDYSKFIQFRVQDASNVAKYVVVTGPGLPTSGLKFLSPRLQRDDPLMAGKRGHYINKKDDGNFSICRVDTTTGNGSANASDCVGMGASGNRYGKYDYTDASLLDTNFATIGFVQGGVYNFAVYNDDGWKTINGQATQTPVATYKRTLTTLPYSAAALAGTDPDHDLYPRLASSRSPVDMATSVRNKTGFTTNLSWNPLGTLPDARRFGWGGVYFYESGPVTAAAWPKADQEWDVYPDAGATSVTGLTVPAPSNTQMTPDWAEAGIYLDDRNGARIWSTVTFN